MTDFIDRPALAGFVVGVVPMEVATVSGDRLDASLKGILFLVAGIAIVSVQDVVIRFLSGGYSVFEIMLVRSVVAVIVVLPLIRLEGGLETLKTRRPFMHAARGLFACFAYTFYYMAIAAMPLADVVAITFSAPLIVTALSVPILKEPVGWHRWTGVGLGFVGVVVMLRPGRGVFDPAAVLALLAALTYAGNILITRQLGRTDSSSSMTFYTCGVYILFAGIAGLALGDGRFAGDGHASLDFLFRAWTIPAIDDLGLMAVTGLTFGAGFYCLTQAYRMGQPSLVAPFEYTAILLAVIWGFAFWRELPDALAYLGIALIVGGGIYVLRRESIGGRRLMRGRTLRPRI